MLVSDKNLIFSFTEKFCNIVNNFTDYAIVSGLTAIACGRTRGTEDIDIIFRFAGRE